MSARAAVRLETLGFGQVFRYTAGKLDWLASGLPSEGKRTGAPYAGEVVRRDVPTCHLNDPVGPVQQRVRAAGWNVCLVVDDNRVVLGLLSTETLDVTPETTAEPVMESGPSTFRPSIPVAELAAYLRRRGEARAVITTSDGELIGILPRADAEAALDRSGASDQGR